MNYFTYNRISSKDMGVFIQSKNIYSAPKYDVTMTAIPGRNGELISPNGRYPNAAVSYTCFIAAKTTSELVEKLTAIKNWLYAEPDRYHDLSDTYDLQHTRKAVFTNKLDITEQVLKIGTFTVNFSAKPFKYLNSGLALQSYAESFTLINPYVFTAKPYIKVNGRGSGRLTIQATGSNKVWQFETLNGYTECDSELMNYYHDTELKNDTVIGDGFPELPSGTITISFEGGITSVEIMPRWVTL